MVCYRTKRRLLLRGCDCTEGGQQQQKQRKAAQKRQARNATHKIWRTRTIVNGLDDGEHGGLCWFSGNPVKESAARAGSGQSPTFWSAVTCHRFSLRRPVA